MTGGVRGAHGVRDDAGAGSVLVLMAVAVLVLVTFAVLVVAGGMGARQQAQSSADLAALAAAARVFEGVDQACGRARTVAQANGVELSSCDVVDGAIEIVVRVASRGPWWPAGFVGRARAGPAP